MPTITADKVLNKSLYAKTDINAVTGAGNFYKTFKAGALIGNVYSWINKPDGLYWAFDGPTPYYVKHDANKLSLLALPKILEEISAEEEKKKLETKGPLQYNIDKYLPYIIGAVVVAVALPTVINLSQKKKVSGMKKNDTTMLLIAGAVAAYYFWPKKKTKAGAPIITDLPVDDPYGNNLPKSNIFENASSVAPGMIENTVSVDAQNIDQALNKIMFVGPFQVTDQGNTLAGGKKGDLGAIKLMK